MISPPATTTMELSADPLDKTAQRPPDHTKALPEQTFPPISSKVMFWRPRYLAQSQWLQHVPFYFWLTEVLEPKLVVDPSVNSAVGYFAICQAIDKLNLDGVIYGALGTQGDSKRVLAYNHDHYREFSSLVAEDEATFLAGFADHSIDILVLKHDSPLLASEAGLACVQQRVSNNGVVLIHGSSLPALHDKHHDWRSRYLSFELTLASGLLLLCMGPQVPSRLQALINQSREPSGQRVIHNIYARLGAASEDNWHRVAQQQQLQQLHETLKLADDKQAQLTQQWQRQQQQDAAALHAITAERDNLQAANSQLSTQLKQQRAKHEQREQALQQDLQTRFDELATLTQLLVTAEAAGDSQRQANQEVAATMKAITSERDGLQAANRQLKETQQQAEQQLQRQLKQVTQQQQDAATALKAVTAERDGLQATNRQLKETQQQAEQQLQRLLKQADQQQQDAATALKAVTAERDDLQAANRQLKETQQQAEQRLQRQQKQADQQQQEAAAALEVVTAERDGLQAANRQLKEHQQQAELQLQRLNAELTRVTEHGAMLERDQVVAAERITTLTHSELALQQALAERFDELATLTNLLVETEREYQRKLAELQPAQPAQPTPLAESHAQAELDRAGIGARLKATLGAVKPRKGQAMAKKAALIRESELFDEAWYLQQHPEAASHHCGAAGHYLEVGAARGANPSPRFDGNAYWQANPDVKQAGMNPLYHFLKFGFAEARLVQPI